MSSILKSVQCMVAVGILASAHQVMATEISGVGTPAAPVAAVGKPAAPSTPATAAAPTQLSKAAKVEKIYGDGTIAGIKVNGQDPGPVAGGTPITITKGTFDLTIEGTGGTCGVYVKTEGGVEMPYNIYSFPYKLTMATPANGVYTIYVSTHTHAESYGKKEIVYRCKGPQLQHINIKADR